MGGIVRFIIIAISISLIILAMVVTYRHEDRTKKEGCMAIVVLTVLWTACCIVLQILTSVITN